MQKLYLSTAQNGPLCVGLDTDPSYLPESIVKSFSSPAQAVLAYNKAIIQRIAPTENSAGLAGCCKVQIAYYEAMGLEGLAVYAQTLKEVRKSGLPVIADIKRGDIADTAKAYARAHFSGDFESDIITVNPYMGFDTLSPFIDFAKPENGGKGVFVLLRTSNPGMADLEKLPIDSAYARFAKETVLDRVGSQLKTIASEFEKIYPEANCSPVGAVVGCTEESDAKQLRNTYPEIFFLIPGYGAQGGAARIAATLLGKAGGTVNSSRGILTAWKKNENLLEKLANATITIDDIADAAAMAACISKQELLKAANLLKD